MIYWLQETTHQLRRSSSPSATLTGAIVGAVVGLVGVLIGQVLQQRRHSQTLQETQRRHSEDLRQAEQGQITERFTRAIEQLGETNSNGEPKLELIAGCSEVEPSSHGLVNACAAFPSEAHAAHRYAWVNNSATCCRLGGIYAL